MAQSVQSTDLSSPGSFASVLAKMTAPQQIRDGLRKPPARELGSRRPSKRFDDDITAITYEQALRAHARRDAFTDSPPEPSESDVLAQDGADEIPLPIANSAGHRIRIFESPQMPIANARRSASITVRLRREECDRIHARAAEAGLTVSAYLRSCVLEVEQLRTQVKQTIAGMRTAQHPAPALAESMKPPATAAHPLLRLFRSRQATHA
jgi:Mobilization protein NikA